MKKNNFLKRIKFDFVKKLMCTLKSLLLYPFKSSERVLAWSTVLLMIGTFFLAWFTYNLLREAKGSGKDISFYAKAAEKAALATERAANANERAANANKDVANGVKNAFEEQKAQNILENLSNNIKDSLSKKNL